MNRLWAMLVIGFLGMSLTIGCGGGGDMVAPEDLGAPTPEQMEAEKRYAEEAAAEEKMNSQK